MKGGGEGDETRVHELMCIMEAVLELHGISSHIKYACSNYNKITMCIIHFAIVVNTSSIQHHTVALYYQVTAL